MKIKAKEIIRRGYFCGWIIHLDGRKYPRARGLTYLIRCKNVAIEAALSEERAKQLDLFPNDSDVRNK